MSNPEKKLLCSSLPPSTVHFVCLFFSCSPLPRPLPSSPLAHSQSLIRSPRFADSIQILRYFSSRLLPQNKCRSENVFFFPPIWLFFIFYFLKFFLSEEQPAWRSRWKGGGVRRRSGEANTRSTTATLKCKNWFAERFLWGWDSGTQWSLGVQCLMVKP